MAIKNILDRARIEGAPLIDGNTVTFIWQGRTAPRLQADFTDWDGAPATMSRAGPNLWTYQVELPAEAYIEYTYLRGEERLPDPFNRRSVDNGVGSKNHYFYMPAAKPNELAQRKPDTPQGTVTRHVVDARGFTASRKRSVALYQPPTTDASPLVVVWDGPDYLRRARLPVIVDNLIAQGRIQPIALAMIQSGGLARSVEYACSEATLGFLMSSILPLAQKHLNLLDPMQNPGAYGVLGASMGGLMALFTSLRIPQLFSKLLSQSGAFVYEAYDSLVFDLIRDGELKSLKIWMDVGLYDLQDLLAANRKMRNALLKRGYQVEYGEYPGGHNYTSWRDEVGKGLEYLFAEPP